MCKLRTIYKAKKGEYIILNTIGTYKYIKTRVISYKLNKDTGITSLSLLKLGRKTPLKITLIPDSYIYEQKYSFKGDNGLYYYLYRYTSYNLYEINKILYNTIKEC